MSQNNGKITAKIFGGSNCFDSKQASKQASTLFDLLCSRESLACVEQFRASPPQWARRRLAH